MFWILKDCMLELWDSKGVSVFSFQLKHKILINAEKFETEL